MSISKMFFLSGLLFLAVACGEPVTPEPAPTPPAIRFSDSGLTVSPEGGEASVKVTATATWQVQTDGQSWYSLVSAPQVYAGESMLKISAEPNYSTAARSATLTFTSGETKASLQISQAFFVPELSFSMSEVTGEGSGGEVVVKTTSNAVWKADDADIDYWFSLSPKSIGKGEGELKVTFNKSYTDQKRSAQVHFRSGEHEKVLTVTQKEGEPIPGGAFVPEGYKLVWQDDFSESSDKIVDKWRYEDWAPGRVNHELQRYVPDDRRTAYTQDGALYIVARKDGGQVISARMNSRESWLYGYFEAAIWLPKGKGTWPAFWMMPNDQSKGWPACGEIDIMEEVGVDADITSSSIHCEAYNHVQNTQKTASRKTVGAENEYHVYALEWTEDFIKTYVDGVLLLEFRNDKSGRDSTWPFNKKFYLTLNLAWGGDWGGYAGVDENALPCTMKVDYVRVYKK
ncbi:MAG: family 16 glycosylhydrolase [Bacteroidales bacterium]|nr:family 16 glycosylhydrolase [Bacteroidales bacterium]